LGTAVSEDVSIPADGIELEGILEPPTGSAGCVVFVHGSGSSRFSSRNRQVARALSDAGLGTLLFDLLGADEQAFDERTARLRFDIGLLSGRLDAALRWLARRPDLAHAPIGLFGASTGAAAALEVAAERPDQVAAVVSRGGRPDLAEGALSRVRAPTLLIVGGRDETVLRLNRVASTRLRCEHRVEVVPGATHLFEEPGALDAVARLAGAWFVRFLRPGAGAAGTHGAGGAGRGAPA
jgi:putative phosphoribosyl transferase